MRRGLGAGLATGVLAASVGAAAPAAATDDTEGLYWDFIGLALPCGTRHIVIEAPPSAWGIRHVAELMDAQLPSLSIHTRQGLTAADRPRALHVRVTVADYGPDGPQYGQAAAPGVGEPSYMQAGYWRIDGPRGVELNTAIDRDPFYSAEDLPQVKKWTAAHEFGHVLGLAHHDLPGIMGGRTTNDHDLGPEEVAAIEDTLQVCPPRRTGVSSWLFGWTRWIK